jgi:hypothetical protein
MIMTLMGGEWFPWKIDLQEFSPYDDHRLLFQNFLRGRSVKKLHI